MSQATTEHQEVYALPHTPEESTVIIEELTGSSTEFEMRTGTQKRKTWRWTQFTSPPASRTPALTGEGREELATLLQLLREGDTLVVTRIDRLARSLRDLQNTRLI